MTLHEETIYQKRYTILTFEIINQPAGAYDLPNPSGIFQELLEIPVSLWAANHRTCSSGTSRPAGALYGQCIPLPICCRCMS